MVTRRLLLILSFLLGAPPAMAARGVSPYLPMNVSPEIERQIERMMILAGKPVMTRPLSAATVLDAVDIACDRDPLACAEVQRFLDGFSQDHGLSFASAQAAITDSDRVALPNRHGMNSDSEFEAAAQIYWQPADKLLFSAGLVAANGSTTPTGTMVSFGNEYFQLDAGYRDHWLSPMSTSSMLIGTQAATMPSVSVSNYRSLTSFNVRYEFFISEMSFSDRIAYGDGFTAGHPQLAGMHVSIEPFPGWSLGVNRIMQYGGGARSDSFSDLIDAFFRPNKYDNTTSGNRSDEFGNQAASLTARYVHAGDNPFSVYFEYAGEDTSTGSNARLGNVSLSAGIHLPLLLPRLDLTVEISEWQNGWYVNRNYGDGLRHDGNVIGHWGADWRQTGDAVGALSLMTRVGWMLDVGQIEATLHLLDNESYTNPVYESAEMLGVRYSRRFGQLYGGLALETGGDSFGTSFSRLAVFVRY